MTGENWLLTGSVVLIALAFIVLVVYLCRTLCGLNRSLKESEELLIRTKAVTEDVNRKLHALDPLFHMTQKAGEVADRCVCKCLAEKCGCNCEDCKCMACCDACTKCRECCEHGCDIKHHQNTSAPWMQVVEWAIVGIGLLQKFKERR